MDREAARIRYLEALYEYSQLNPGLIPSADELLGNEKDGQSNNYWRSIIDSMEGDGLVRAHHTMGGASAQLTHRGEEHVEEVRRLRKNPAARRKAAANNLLHWIDQQDQHGASWMQVGPAEGGIFYLGEPISQQEIFAAAEQLAQNELLEGKPIAAEIPGYGLVRMLPLGRRCVESDLSIDEFLDRQRRREPSVQNVFSGQFTGSNIAASSSNFSQTLSSSGLAGDDLKVMVAAVLESMPALGLDDKQSQEVQRSADAVQAELERAEPDGPMVKTLMGRIVEGIGSGVQTATGASLSLLIKWQLARMGIPLEGGSE